MPKRGSVPEAVFVARITTCSTGLVHRIRSGDFTEMRDLLTNNIALHDQLEVVQGPLLNVVTPGVLRAEFHLSFRGCFASQHT